jgi:hypothetical protein
MRGSRSKENDHETVLCFDMGDGRGGDGNKAEQQQEDAIDGKAGAGAAIR